MAIPLKFQKILKKILNTVSLTNYATPAQIKMYFISVGAIALLFVVIYVPIKFFSNRTNNNTLRSKRTFTSEENSALLTKPAVGEFAFPNNLFEFAPSLSSSMDQDVQWSMSVVDKYWLDPKKVGITKLPERNQKMLEDYLESAKKKDQQF
ncbi:MAG: hypothetical protein ACRCVN_01830 [Spirochaetia bacterium]